MIRLDKFFTETATLSRKVACDEIKRGKVLVNGTVVKDSSLKIDETTAKVVYNGEEVKYQKYVYIMLNKPEGVVSATEDTRQKTVLDLLPEKYKKLGLFPCGRLDKDTLGLVMLTNDGETAHRLLSPKNHVKKTYKYKCADPLTDENKIKIENGLELRDGYITKPCNIKVMSPTEGEITLTEGKYHEIKRLFGATHNKITYLERITFGFLILDKKLKRGEWRELTADEINHLLKFS